MSARIENRQNGADLSKLTAKQRLFCLEMIGDANFNATEAARRAGYAIPQGAVGGLLKHKAIKRFLGKQKRLREERTQLTSDVIWQQLHRAVFFDPIEAFESAGKGWWIVKDLEVIPQEFRQLIEEIKITTRPVRVLVEENGEQKVKIVDKPLAHLKFVSKGGALATAARHAIPQEHEVMMKIDYDRLYRDNRNEPNEIEGEVLRIVEGDVQGQDS